MGMRLFPYRIRPLVEGSCCGRPARDAGNSCGQKPCLSTADQRRRLIHISATACPVFHTGVQDLHPQLVDSLFADAEAAKNFAQELIRGDGTGDFTQGILRAMKLFSDEFTRTVNQVHAGSA